MRLRNRPFTLIEILVVCVIISTAFGSIAFFSHKVYGKMRFERAVDQVRSSIKEKRLQALTEDQDLTYKIKWPGTLYFNGKQIEEIVLLFYCNGVIRPEGALVLRMGEQSYALTLS